MKPIIPFALLGALFAVGVAGAAVTDPVGYITHTIAGTTTSGTSSAETFISPSLTSAVEFAGVSTADPSGGSVITFAGSVPTDLGNGDVLEITSGVSAGFWSTVASSTATSVTIIDAFPVGLGAAVQVAVRPHSTLGSFLGENEPGLIDFDGVQANDEVQVLNPVSQSVDAFAWVTGPNLGLPEGHWYDLVAGVIADDVVIEPGTAIKIKRVGSSDLAFASVGSVKVTPTQVDVFANFNWIGTPLATGGTLNGMTFNSQLNQFDGVSPNYDELQILRPSQNVDPYAAIDDGAGGTTMFNLVTSTDAGAEVFPEGTGVVINRIGNPSSTVTIPATTVAP